MSAKLICTMRYFESDEVKYTDRVMYLPSNYEVVALVHEGAGIRHTFYGKFVSVFESSKRKKKKF